MKRRYSAEETSAPAPAPLASATPGATIHSTPAPVTPTIARADGGGGGEIPQGHGGAGDGGGDGARVETTREPKITPRIVPVDERVRVEVSLAHDEIVRERDGHGGRHHRGGGGE